MDIMRRLPPCDIKATIILANVVFLLVGVAGGPDRCLLTHCDVIKDVLTLEQHHKLRDAVQGLQAAESYVAQQQLGRNVPQPSGVKAAPSKDILESWKAGNATGVQQLLEGAELLGHFGGSAAAAAALAASCLSHHLNPDAFAGRPAVSILLNYFKRLHIISQLSSRMQAACADAGVACELVVNVDNPHEAAAWAAEAAASGGFVVPVFSANLHEARGYNRAARLARGRYLVVWQDDQIPLPDGSWLSRMVRIFEAHPLLGILGMNTYRMCRQAERGNNVHDFPWEPDPATAGAGGAAAGGEPPVVWSYVHLTDFAPMAVRAAAFRELGGLEEGWSRRGECGITTDWELCVRAWLSGWQVGHMVMGNVREGDSQTSGTHTPTASWACWDLQADASRRAMDKRFLHRRDALLELCERSWALNMLTFRLPQPERCPYNTTGMKWGNCSAPLPHARQALIAALQLPDKW